MPESTLPPASLKLLREIAAYDDGTGVLFESMPRARWRHPRTNDVFNHRTFYPLAGQDLVDVGTGNDPVKVTAAGRQYLAGLDAARGGGR